MNETVLFLVIGAAVILVGLFLWSRMEAKKNNQSKVGLSKESREEIYQRMTQIKPPRRESTQRDLVSQLKDDQSLIDEPFEVEAVSEEEPVNNSVALKPTEPVKEVVKPQEVVQSAAIQKEQPKEAAHEKVAPKQEPLNFEAEKPQVVEEKKEEQQSQETTPVSPSIPKEGLVRFQYDEVTETVGMVQSVRPVDGGKMMEMVAMLQKLNLPLRIYLRRVDNKRWYQPNPLGRYNELAVVLLLANRQGCINEMDASRFATTIQQIGIALEADSDTEASHEIVQRAQKLYNDVARLDVQLNFIMASKEPLNPNDVAEAAQLAGFTQLNPMRYFLGSVQHISQATIFLTQDDFDRRYLTIALDAPLAQPDSNPLRTLFSVCNDLCARLNLQLQDSRDRPINTESAQSINYQLKKYYADMYKANIEPGSPRARVLFTRD
ncbi:MAG TPA: hypothetical protein IAC56_05140 [Candidatus Aphodousia faecigallinarum]|uniref:Cell division protein ZipA n=1 Tax=Candidatus Aphodousia faecigallinarum TaxID=2840677 RepID=A0A9D1IKD1_9BURK|nr:hypothetical protein [Candidatus Aphodousia faecigallinarum]